MDNPHDIVRVDGTLLECSCGRLISADTLAQARRNHEAHWGIEGARAALQRAQEAS